MCVCVFRDGGRGEGAGAWEGKVNSSHSLQSFLLRTSSSPFPQGPSLLLHPPQPIQALVPILDPRAKGKREGQHTHTGSTSSYQYIQVHLPRNLGQSTGSLQCVHSLSQYTHIKHLLYASMRNDAGIHQGARDMGSALVWLRVWVAGD